MGWIYVIKNSVNGKKYVGLTNGSYIDRFKIHHRNSHEDYGPKLLYRAMRKHGRDSFWVEALEECEDAILGEREKFWISELNSLMPNGYNMTEGGDGVPGWLQTNEQKRKQSESMKKAWQNSEKLKAGWDNPERRINLSSRMSRQWSNPDYRDKQIKKYRKNFPKGLVTVGIKRKENTHIGTLQKYMGEKVWEIEELVLFLMDKEFSVCPSSSDDKESWIRGYIRGAVKNGSLSHTVGQMYGRSGDSVHPNCE